MPADPTAVALEAPVIPLSVLDVATVPAGGAAGEALLDVVHAAQAADRAGYRRFWVADPTNAPRRASSSPAVLLAHLAALTRHIRVGSGGAPLAHRAPLTIAERFAVLQLLHGGRTDLAVGHDHLAPCHSPTLPPRLVGELAGFLHDNWPPGQTSTPPEPPRLFVVGGSEHRALVAAARGLPFVFAGPPGPAARPAAVASYRAEFTPGPHGPDRPRLIASVHILCAETDAEAERLALRIGAARVHAAHGWAASARPPTAARARHLTEEHLARLRLVRGSPDTVAAEVADVAAALDADEVMVVPYDLTGTERARTLRLLAEAAIGTSAHAGHRACDLGGRAGGFRRSGPAGPQSVGQ
ncbi:MsnO8 family LLM class oxidoreductase [Streptomyces profundus]|uniref:MsnO8 family LLM class oxidoreductase n=1 Tax=Streptomyces profundus TaxID=2867410 RepID=UPI001D16B66F|nr:MsnO8 family LLM class oxidoreductase [Streptomyces sp. MA3_2.13]UED87807.1 MsnO8 family LLM class oxidoreductase [Streptomyces sp. MA3_2.13]